MEEAEHLEESGRGRRSGLRQPRRMAPGEAARAVPVSMGSHRSMSVDVGGLLVTHVWFPPGTVLHSHVHERSVMGTMVRGSFDLRMCGRSRDCTPDTVLVEPGGQRHENRVGSAGAEVVVLQPAPERELPLECQRLLDRPDHFRNARMAMLARRMRSDLAQPDALARLSIEGLALEMLALAGARERSDRLKGAPPAWLARVCELIHECYLEDLTIDGLAAEAGVHPAHLTRVFRRHRGVSLGHYIRTLRLDWAASRLRHSEDPQETLARIALRAGFSDQSHFTRAFRKHVGVTPGQYRGAGRRARSEHRR